MRTSNSTELCVESGITTLARIALLIVSMLCGRTSAQCTQWHPGAGVPGVHGTVNAATSWDPDGPGPQPQMTVVAGEFDLAGNLQTRNIAAWNGSAWTPLGRGLQGWIYALTVLPNGGLVAGGVLSPEDGVVCNVARWDGRSWIPRDNATGDWVYALGALPNGDLVAGGTFTTIDGVPAARIARWNGSSWSPLGMGVEGGTSPVVRAVTVLGNGDVLAAGTFTLAGGVA